MESTQVVGPYLNNNLQVIETDQDYTLDNGDRVVIVTGPGVVLTMPLNPTQGETHTVTAQGFDVSVPGTTVPVVLNGASAEYVYTGTTWNGPSEGVGTVLSVSGTLPIVSSGGVNPVISIDPATNATPGSMSAADKTKLDGIVPGAGVVTVGATLPITSSGGINPVIGIDPATDGSPGSMSAADKTKLDTYPATYLPINRPWQEKNGNPGVVAMAGFYGTAFNNLTNAATAQFPAAPASGDTYAVAAEDNSVGGGNTITVDGNGNQVESPAAPGTLEPTYIINLPGVATWAFRRGAWRLAS